MRRRTFDTLMSTGGIVLTVVLLVAGALLFVGGTFANSQVHDQLAAQKVFFPAKGSQALAAPEIGTYLNKYAGQQLTTGAQAEAYANHFIKVHLNEVADGKTYAEMSTLARANPDNATMKAQVDTLFRGETLRSMLLTAYAFWKLGQIAFMAGIAAFVSAGLMGLLTILGFWHRRKVSPDAEILAPPMAIRATA
jgi:hypothetical protein